MNAFFKKLLPYLPAIVIVCFTLFFYLNYWNINKSIAWDGLGYYLYLPSTFIYDDALLNKYELYESLMKQYDLSTTFYQVCKAPNGNWIMKYTMGKAVMMSPFYFVSDWVAQLTDYKRDGLSLPYHIGAFISGVVYLTLGCLMFTKLLVKIFKAKMAFILMTIFLFGTSWYTNATMGVGNIHVILFFLYSLFLWYTVRWHETKRTKHLILLGIVFGLMILCRPTEGIALFIPLLWGVKSWVDFKERVGLIKKLKSQFVLLLLVVLIIGMPQILYWQIVGGSWLITDYGNPAEGFDWLSPHIIDALFSYKKGWLLYTPMMLFGIAGIYWLYKKKSDWFLPLLVFTGLNIYVVSSWSCWWYAQSFSNRGFSHASLILIIPLGFALKSVIQSKLKFVFIGLAGLFFLLNQFQAWQYSNWIIVGSEMTQDYYWRVFGKTSVTKEDKKLLSVDRVHLNKDQNIPSPEERVLSKTLKFDFEDIENPNKDNEFSAFSGKYGAFINGDLAFTKSIRIPYHEITNKDCAWLEIKGKIKPTGDYKKNPFSFITTFNYKGANYGYKGIDSQSQDWKVGEWNEFKFIYLTPHVRTDDDELMIYLWNRSNNFTALDDIEINVFEKK